MKGISQSDSTLLQRHVTYLCHYAEPRSAASPDILNDAAQYIKDQLAQHSNHTFFQRYQISGEVFRNVIASFGVSNSKRIIIGAHYDALGGGADDNASGVSGLLELARLLAQVDSSLLFRIDLVAWSGAEGVADKPRNMGSYKHALSLQDAAIPVAGVIDLEGIGYYNDSVKSQTYPWFFYRDIHGNKGNFIALYERMGMGTFGMMMKSLLKQYGLVNLISFKPIFHYKKMETNDFRNFIRFDFPVLLMSDTGKFRNKNLHTTFDTPNTLNYTHMQQLVDMLFQSVIRYKE